MREALVEAGPECRSLADDLKHDGGVWHTDTLFDHARPKVAHLLALGWLYVKDWPNFDPMVDEGKIRLTPWGELLVGLDATNAFSI